MLKLWIQSRVDLDRKSTPNPILKHLCNSKHNQLSIKLQRVWILQSLNTLDSTILYDRLGLSVKVESEEA